MSEFSCARKGRVFVCHNSYSLACAEYLLKTRGSADSVLIYAAGVFPKSNQITSNLWSHIHFLKYEKNIFHNLRSLLLLASKYDILELYVSNFLDKSERLLVMKAGCPVFFLDDGVATITMSEKGMQELFYLDKMLYKTRYFLFSFYCFLRYGNFPFPLWSVKRQITKYITTFPVAIDGLEMEKIPYPYKYRERCASRKSMVFFAGQNLYSNPLIITHDEYYERLFSIACYYESKGIKFVYFPHPREYDIPQDLLSKSNFSDYSFERYVTEFSSELPSHVASFVSTVLPALTEAGLGVQIDAWKLSSVDSSMYDYIYRFFERIGINVIGCAVAVND